MRVVVLLLLVELWKLLMSYRAVLMRPGLLNGKARPVHRPKLGHAWPAIAFEANINGSGRQTACLVTLPPGARPGRYPFYFLLALLDM